MKKLTVALIAICGSSLVESFACSVSVSLTHEPLVPTQTGHIEVDGVRVPTFTMGKSQPAYNAQADKLPKATFIRHLNKNDLSELIAFPIVYRATPVNQDNWLASWFQKDAPTVTDQWILVPRGWIYAGSSYSGDSFQRGDCSMVVNGVPKDLFFSRELSQDEKDTSPIYSLEFAATTSARQAEEEAKLYLRPNQIDEVKGFGRGEFGDQVKWIDNDTLSYKRHEETVKISVERLNQHTLSYSVIGDKHRWMQVVYFNRKKIPSILEFEG